MRQYDFIIWYILKNNEVTPAFKSVNYGEIKKQKFYKRMNKKLKGVN